MLVKGCVHKTHMENFWFALQFWYMYVYYGLMKSYSVPAGETEHCRGGYLLMLGKYDGFMTKVMAQCSIIYAGLYMLKNHW